MKIIVDCDRCQGHALCAAQAPDVYELNEQGYNSMGEFTVKPGQEEAAIEAANWCPEEAIRVVA